jgi:hypothetical protein
MGTLIVVVGVVVRGDVVVVGFAVLVLMPTRLPGLRK